MLRMIALTSAIFAASAPAPQAQTVALSPSGPWKVEYADNTCNLVRPYSDGQKTHYFALIVEPVSRTARLRLATLEKVKARSEGAALVKADDMRSLGETRFVIYPEAKGVALRTYLFPHFEQTIMQARRSLHIETTKHGAVRLDLGNFQKPLQAFRTCIDDLHRGLGIDPALLNSIAVPPQGRASRFVRRPPDFADAKLLFWVTPTGTVDSCRVLESSFEHESTQRMCRDLQRKGRFQPARDARGAAIRAPVFEQIGGWRIIFGRPLDPYFGG